MNGGYNINRVVPENITPGICRTGHIKHEVREGGAWQVIAHIMLNSLNLINKISILQVN